MKKKIILLVFTLIFSLLLGCQGTADERQLSISELKMSDDAKIQAAKSWDNWCIEQNDSHWFETYFPGKEWGAWVWDEIADAPNEYTMLGWRYYGTFNDCIVWCEISTGESVESFKLADSWFYNPSCAHFRVTKGQKLYTIQEAYNAGYLGAEDIAIVAKRHEAYNEAAGSPHPDFYKNG